MLTREEIRKELWPDNTIVEFEHSINAAMSRLRQALGDSGDHPRYIETLARRGYRWMVPVEGMEGSRAVREFSAEATARPVAMANPVAGLARKKYVLLAACFALLAAAFAAYHFWPRSNPPSGPGKITRISEWNKPMNGPRLSPDGHAVAFASPVSGINQIFLMLTSGGEPLQLTNDEWDKFVDDFSPDGKEVYYGSPRRDEVWAVPTLGGSPRHVASAMFVLPSPDGTSIFCVKPDNPAIFRVGKSGLNEDL